MVSGQTPRAFSDLVFSVFAVFEVVSAFSGCELVDEIPDAIPQRVLSAFGVLPQLRPQF